MQQVFELYINGTFIRYIKPEEVCFISWIDGIEYRLKSVKITEEQYKALFNL